MNCACRNFRFENWQGMDGIIEDAPKQQASK